MAQDDLRRPLPKLTDLELKCLEAFWNRKPAKQIAAELEISEAWVNKNLANVRRKLHVNSSAEAAALVFGGTRGSIRKYYYQETPLPDASAHLDGGWATAEGPPTAAAASEQPLINRYGPLPILAAIVLIAVGSIVGVTLLIDASDGLYQLWKAAGR